MSFTNVRFKPAGADLLSRDSFDDKSRLDVKVFDQACESLGVNPICDAFAGRGSNICDLPYYSRSRSDADEPGCLGVDALTSAWPEGTTYAFPPLPLVEVAIHKALMEAGRPGRQVMLVVPHWPQRAWTALLQSFPSCELGKLAEVTSLPEGSARPIESWGTWTSTVLKAYLIRNGA